MQIIPCFKSKVRHEVAADRSAALLPAAVQFVRPKPKRQVCSALPFRLSQDDLETVLFSPILWISERNRELIGIRRISRIQLIRSPSWWLPNRGRSNGRCTSHCGAGH